MSDPAEAAAWGLPWAHALAGLVVATASGLVIGLERERSAQAREHRRFVGVRTLALIGLGGGMSGLLGSVWGLAIPIVFLLSVAGLSLGASLADTDDPPGVTTEVSAFAVALMGLTATSPLPGIEPLVRFGLVGAVALLTMALLSLRGPLHRLAAAVSQDELVQVAQLGLLLLVALPILPDTDLWGIPGLNPRQTGMMVALIAGIGLAGYLAVRNMGPERGMAVAGLLGGLVSSTAVTLGFAGQCKDAPNLVRPASRGIVLACVVMLPRQLLEVGVVAPSLLPIVALPLGVMAVVGVLGAGAAFLQDSDPPAGSSDRLRNPGSMGEALKFGALYVAVVAISGEALRLLGPQGLYVSSVLAGVADVDAITLSVSHLVGEGLDHTVAARALTLASMTNTTLKLAMAAVVGGLQVGRAVGLLLAPMVVAGGIALLFL